MFVAILLSCFVVAVPHAEVREKPSGNSKVISELLFSEQVEVLEIPSEVRDEWVKICNKIDNYKGWVKKEALVKGADEVLLPSGTQVAIVDRLRAHIYSVPDFKYGPVITLGFESRLRVLDATDPQWIAVQLPTGATGYVHRGDVVFEKKMLSVSQLPEFSKRFLGLPYTWGGRTSFGYDCSGFVQMLYRQAGIFLPRDSKDQASWQGCKEVSLTDIQPGDLLFWGRQDAAIYHVGMYIGSDQFIHTNVSDGLPYIHVSSLSNYNAQNAQSYCMARTVK